MPYSELKDYPAGTRISIGERFFVRANYGSFWTEEHEIPGNRNTRPSASLKHIEIALNVRHVVVIGDLVDRHEAAIEQSDLQHLDTTNLIVLGDLVDRHDAPIEQPKSGRNPA